MSAARRPEPVRPAPSRRRGRAPRNCPPAELRARLAEAEATIRAIRSGEVDAVVVTGLEGPQVFTLQGAEHAYRVLIESMNEGAVTLTANAVILYANSCFARMIKCPLEQVTGAAFHRFLSAEDRTTLRPLLLRASRAGAKAHVLLTASDGSQMPVQVSIRLLARNGGRRATIGMVVTDLTVARRSEDMLRALMQRVMRIQENERGRVALDLHDHITQLLCAVLFRCQSLADNLSVHDGPSKKAAMKLRPMLAQAVAEVERISRSLRPSILNQLGLESLLRDTSTEFAGRTGVEVKVACVGLLDRLPPDTELTLYRILQEALKNVEQHARARHVTVGLRQTGAFVHLVVQDDGIGFEPDGQSGRRRGKTHLGLLGMRERAIHMGGALAAKSMRDAGTRIEVRIPVTQGVAQRRKLARRRRALA